MQAPDCVRGLVLALAGARGDPGTIRWIRTWIDLARAQRWNEVYADIVGAAFTGLRGVLWRGVTPLLLGRPAIPSNFIVSLEACIEHDARERLGAVRAPTLVIGGTEDRLVPAPLFEELARLVPGASLRLIPGAGHGVYEERQPEYDAALVGFLRACGGESLRPPAAA